MITLSSITDEELNKLVSSDNAPAMREKAIRYMARGNFKKARQFFTLSSILGDRLAHIELAKICEEEENFEEAYSLYAKAYSKGEDSVLPKIAVLAMKNDYDLGLELLRQHAFDGHWGCIKELVNVYRANPDNAEYQAELGFWITRLEEMEARAAAKLKRDAERDAAVAASNAAKEKAKEIKLEELDEKYYDQEPLTAVHVPPKKKKPASGVSGAKKPASKKPTSKK